MHINKMSSAALLAATIATIATGCDAAPAVDASLDLRSDQPNGVSLNSATINGARLNGWQLNGEVINGWQLNGWQLNGWQLNSVSLAGTLFTATVTIKGKKQLKSGPELVGSQITLSRNGSTYKLRIDDIFPDPANPSGDVYFYAISLYDGATKSWSSLCKDADGAPTEAIPLRHTWDLKTGDRIDNPHAVTIACRGGALAKCVEWGYRPWATRSRCADGVCSDQPLTDAHQACTRMVRADYCGDGTPHTFNGTPIDIYDRFAPPIQLAATLGASAWGAEAEWGPDGALCVGDSLRLKMLDDLGIDHDVPSCLDDLDDLGDCGQLPAQRGAEVADRYCSQWSSDPDACELATVQGADE